MQVTENTNQEVTVVVFKAPWCQPCKAYAKTIEEAKEIYKDTPEVKFITYDIEDKEAFVETLKYKIKGVPTTVILKDATEISRKVGALPLGSLASQISNAL